MKKWRKSLTIKLLVSLLAIILGFGCGFGVVASALLANRYYEDSYLDSGLYRAQLNTYEDMAWELYHLQDRTDLSYAEQERKKELEDTLNHTSFAFTIYLNDDVQLTNRGKTDWNDAQSAGQLYPDTPLYETYENWWESHRSVEIAPTISVPAEEGDEDLDTVDQETSEDRYYGNYDVLVAKDDAGDLFLVEDWRVLEGLAIQGMLYGVKNEDPGIKYAISYDEAIKLMEMLQLRELLGEPAPQEEEYEVVTDFYRIEYGTLAGLPVEDEFARQEAEYHAIREFIPGVTAGTAISAVLLLAAVIWLMAAAGWHKDEEEVSLRGLEKLPADASLVVWGGLALLALILATQIFHQTPVLRRGSTVEFGIFVGCCAAVGVALTIPVLNTILAQLKCRCLLRRTILSIPFRWCWRKIKGFFRWLLGDGALSRWAKVHLIELGRLMKKHITTSVVVVGAFFVYIFFGLICSRMSISAAMIWLIVNIAAMLGAEYWLLKFQDIREGARMIAQGNVEHKVDTNRMPSDLKEIANSLNNLSEGVNKAVEERMKSERFRAELITNVSHDLKTPLTSIINYIDLLKKTPVENPEAKEYIEVLDRKSQQLKKLTEDLVEASKASTGSMPTRLEVLNLSQLVNQALGEYDERLLAKRLHVVVNQPEELMVQADGKHLWRVLDNLLSNCVKYAMPGTRVYLTSTVKDLFAEITVKNISEAPLNLTEEELMERFVQGDSSRSAEGSGLGLSIARSLMTLQHGSFSISVDGDLFKATFMVPLAEVE